MDDEVMYRITPILYATSGLFLIFVMFLGAINAKMMGASAVYGIGFGLIVGFISIFLGWIPFAGVAISGFLNWLIGHNLGGHPFLFWVWLAGLIYSIFPCVWGSMFTILFLKEMR